MCYNHSMYCFRHPLYFKGTRVVAVCVLACACAGLFATLAYAAAPAVPQKKHNIPSAETAKSGWDFQSPDKSAQNARWRESISATLQRTTFAPHAPAGRYLQHNATIPGKRLPPAQIDDLDKMRPQEKTQIVLGGKTPVHGEFTKENIVWRQHSDLIDTTGTNPALREEHRAGAYADFHPAEDVELKLGPEYHLGASARRPEQTGHVKDNPGTLGVGMKLKIDF